MYDKYDSPYGDSGPQDSGDSAQQKAQEAISGISDNIRPHMKKIIAALLILVIGYF